MDNFISNAQQPSSDPFMDFLGANNNSNSVINTPLDFPLLTFEGVNGTNKTNGKDYATTTYSAILELVAKPTNVIKSKAKAIIPSSYIGSDGRDEEIQALHGAFGLLVADIDNGNLELDTLISAVNSTVGSQYDWAIHSTSSSLETNKKWRLLLPIVAEVNGEQFVALLKGLYSYLEQHLNSATCDPKMIRNAQICFLPNIQPSVVIRVRQEDGSMAEVDTGKQTYYLSHINAAGARLDALGSAFYSAGVALLEDEANLLKAAKKAQAKLAEEHRARNAVAKESHALGSGGYKYSAIDVIDAFNNQYSVASLFDQYGYSFEYENAKGSQYHSPHQTTTTAAVLLTKDGKWVSLSGSDDAAGVGAQASSARGNGAISYCRYGDAFDLFQFYEHGNDKKAAIKAAAKLLGMESKKELPVFDIETVDADTGEISRGVGNNLVAGSGDFIVDLRKFPELTVHSKSGKYLPEFLNLRITIGAMEIRHDGFTDTLMYWSRKTQKWMKFTDGDYVNVAVALQQMGFANPSLLTVKEIVRSVGIADDHRFDSAAEWANSLKWDGVERSKNLFSTYFGVEHNLETEAASLYLASAMGARILGASDVVDMVPVLIGDQGKYKSSAVKALAPTLEQFAEIDLSSKDNDISRTLRGKSVLELGELRGLKSRDADSIKSWISRQTDEWVPKYMEFSTLYQRRCVMIATTNEDEFLTDITGNRRWIILHVTKQCNPDLLRQHINQIWAEAIVIYRKHGVLFNDIKNMAAHRHAQHMVVNEVITDDVENWLVRHGLPSQIHLPTLVKELYPFKADDRKTQLSIGDSLGALGYKKGMAPGGKRRVWVKKA